MHARRPPRLASSPGPPVSSCGRALLALALFASCSAGRAVQQTAASEDLPALDPAADRMAALGDWDSLAPLEFERRVLEALPGGAATELDEFLLAELEGALDPPGPRAVRAAVVLGRSASRASSEVLLRRLERRVARPDRSGDAADVVAAGALERLDDGAWAASRLAALGAGTGAHPDLEVRVACAVAALAHGSDEVVPFLLQVLRIGTPAGALDRRDFPVSDTTTWARSEAALALARRAACPDTYPADGPLDARDAATRDLAERLRALGALR